MLHFFAVSNIEISECISDLPTLILSSSSHRDAMIL